MQDEINNAAQTIPEDSLNLVRTILSKELCVETPDHFAYHSCSFDKETGSSDVISIKGKIRFLQENEFGTSTFTLDTAGEALSSSGPYGDITRFVPSVLSNGRISIDFLAALPLFVNAAAKNFSDMSTQFLNVLRRNGNSTIANLARALNTHKSLIQDIVMFSDAYDTEIEMYRNIAKEYRVRTNELTSRIHVNLQDGITYTYREVEADDKNMREYRLMGGYFDILPSFAMQWSPDLPAVVRISSDAVDARYLTAELFEKIVLGENSPVENQHGPFIIHEIPYQLMLEKHEYIDYLDERILSGDRIDQETLMRNYGDLLTIGHVAGGTTDAPHATDTLSKGHEMNHYAGVLAPLKHRDRGVNPLVILPALHKSVENSLATLLAAIDSTQTEIAANPDIGATVTEDEKRLLKHLQQLHDNLLERYAELYEMELLMGSI